jgi:hypothetical protein
MLVGLGLLVGCGPSAPPPIRGAERVKGVEQAKPNVELPSGPTPTATDPAAKAVVDAALKAHTGGRVGTLDALRTARKVVAGTLEGPNGRIANEWTFTWQWPDKMRVGIRIAGQPPAGIRRVGHSAWMTVAGNPEQPITEPNLSGTKAESFAECLLVLVPLADPRAVFTPAGDLTVRDRKAVGVRVSGPDWPGALCHFDAETNKLAQVSYQGHEGGPTTKEVVVLTDKAFGGVTVPERLALRWNGREVGEWTVKELTFPATDPKAFEP